MWLLEGENHPKSVRPKEQELPGVPDFLLPVCLTFCWLRWDLGEVSQILQRNLLASAMFDWKGKSGDPCLRLDGLTFAFTVFEAWRFEGLPLQFVAAPL